MEFSQSVIDKYDKMIWKIVNKYTSQADKDVMWRIDRADLHSEGLYALANACKKFDETLGFQFSTYAYRAIDNQIKAYIRSNIRAYSVNQNDNKKIGQVVGLLKEGKTLDDISEELNIPYDEVVRYSTANDFSYSLDYQIDDDGSKMNFSDIVEDNTNEINERDQALEQLIDDIDCLSPEEKLLYKHYRGLFGHKKMAKRKLAKIINVVQINIDDEIKRISDIVEEEIRTKFYKYYQ